MKLEVGGWVEGVTKILTSNIYYNHLFGSTFTDTDSHNVVSSSPQ